MLNRLALRSGGISLVVAGSLALSSHTGSWADGGGIVVTPNNRGADVRVESGGSRPGRNFEDSTEQAGSDENVKAEPFNCGFPGAELDIVCGLGGNIGSELPVVDVDPAKLVQAAVANLVIPRPPDAQVRPRLTFPDGRAGAIVGMPMWLWIPIGKWRSPQPVHLEAGPAWVDAYAEPVSHTWTFGDGNGVACRVRGTEYRVGMDPAKGSPDCGYKYVRSSKGQPNGAYTISVTVHWRIAWVGSGNTAGELPLFPVSTSFQYVVREARAELVSP